jgi:cysteinyl-tRNA synthetase
MLKLYNTLTRRLEPLEPLEPGRVRMYSCGPTVYRYIHIGNLRTFLMADWLRRSLTYLGLDVYHIKNLTDVGHMRVERLDRGEDKLVAQARREGKSSAEIAAFYTEAFLRDEQAMNILPAHVFPRATDHIAEMIAIIAELERKGLAYVGGENVYFDVGRFPEYGRLSGNQIASLLEGVRDTTDPHKRNPEDFALWKRAEPGREMAWESPWGLGFPGWHIECSAMSIKYLGRRFDIHTGGVDNIFPHHEGEIAQSEGYTGEPFVNIWVHAQHLLVDGLKMAKSTGNAYTLADIEARGFEPMALRYLFATIRYRSRSNFTFTALHAAQTALNRLRTRLARLANESSGVEAVVPADSPWRARFVAALSADLNIPRVIAAVWDLLRGRGATPPAAERLALILDIDRVLGLQLREWLAGERAEPVAIPDEVAPLVAERAGLRAAGRYAEADALRAAIAAAGYAVRDTRDGPIVVARPPEEEFRVITRPLDVADASGMPDRYDFSVNLIARDSRDDLERCITSIAQHAAGRNIELVIVDNGSTDETVHYLQDLVRHGVTDATGRGIPLTVFFADHNLGFAAGRNATMRASRGRYLVLLDTSIELQGDIWAPIERALADETIGMAGPYGLVTRNLQDFYEDDGPEVDAVEGYLMAFRRALLPEIGWFNEKFRFYRLLDIYESFMAKTGGYRVVTLPEVAARITKHPHREWYALSEDERAEKSKKNYDIFKRRWHHGQSLLAVNLVAADRWFGHDHPNHMGADHTHTPEELPPPGVPHVHLHQHWPDHAHEHPHTHESQR